MAKIGSELVKFDAAQYPALSKETRSRTMEVIAENTDGVAEHLLDPRRLRGYEGALQRQALALDVLCGVSRRHLEGVVLRHEQLLPDHRFAHRLLDDDEHAPGEQRVVDGLHHALATLDRDEHERQDRHRQVVPLARRVHQRRLLRHVACD